MWAYTFKILLNSFQLPVRENDVIFTWLADIKVGDVCLQSLFTEGKLHVQNSFSNEIARTLEMQPFSL